MYSVDNRAAEIWNRQARALNRRPVEEAAPHPLGQPESSDGHMLRSGMHDRAVPKGQSHRERASFRLNCTVVQITSLEAMRGGAFGPICTIVQVGGVFNASSPQS
jgi:hypothetical protein